MKEYFAKGKRGIVYISSLNGKKVLIKEFNPSASVNTIAHEAQMLQLVNKQQIGPIFIKMQDGALVREFIDGEEIVDWIAEAGKSMIKKVLLHILDQCRTLDTMKINKLEMTHPHKHILVRKSIPIFIDFDRAKFTQKPKNVTQVIQWFTGKELSTPLQAKGIHISREKMLSLAKQYKGSYDAIAYRQMQELIGNA